MGLPKDYICDGQLNIWDYFGTEVKEEEEYVGTPSNAYSHEDLPTLDEVAQEVKKQCGLFLKPIMTDCVNRGWEWHYHWKHSELTIRESHFYGDKTKRFIAVDWSTTHSGFGCPCTTLTSVIHHVNNAIKEAENEENRRKKR